MASPDEIKTLRVAADLLFESGAATTGHELLAIINRLRSGSTCRACNGSGRRSLAKFEAQAVAMLTAAGVPVPTVEIGRRLWPRVKGPAVCNRLARMEHDGLIVSRRDDDDPRAKTWTVRRG